MMTFEQVQVFVLPLGKYKGQELDKVAETDEGLLYLDWLCGQDWVHGGLKLALEVYLGDPGIKKDLDDLVARGAHRRRGSE
jgi:uncharacterized protein (DUF3820 family)